MKVRPTAGRAALRLVKAWLLTLTALVGAAHAQSTDRPTLRVESGTHTASIGRLGADGSGRLLVTASSDKTARVWDAATGALLSVLRPPIGPGNEGMLYAAALSPDGRTVVCGGFTGPDSGPFCLYVFDRVTGQMTKRLGALPGTVFDLAFSPDGRWLAATLDKGGVRLFRSADWAETGRDEDYGSASYGVSFTQVGGALRLAAGALDDFVRLYAVGPDGRLQRQARVRVKGGHYIDQVAFSPDGGRLAVGFADAPRVAVVSGQDLKLLYAPDAGDLHDGFLSSVCWSADGQSLYAGGIFFVNNVEYVRRWTGGGRGGHVDIPLGDNTIEGLQTRPGGGFFFATGEPALGAVGDDDRPLVCRQPAVADFRVDGDALRISDDGATVAFPVKAFSADRTVFSVPRRALTPDGGADALRPARRSADGMDIRVVQSYSPSTLNGVPLPLDGREISHAAAVAPDRRSFLLGTTRWVRRFDRVGRLLWKTLAPGDCWDVDVSGDGRLAVAAFNDGTVRWYAMRDGAELLALFPQADGKRWALWTPSGYFDASPGGEDLIGWQVDRGPDRAADFFPLSRFRAAYARPDVIDAVLPAGDEAEAVRQADAGSHRRDDPGAGDIATSLPPVVSILSPQPGAAVSTSTVTVRYVVRTPSDRAVTSIRALVNGRPVKTARDLQVVSAEGASQEIVVPVPPQDCQITLIASSGLSTSEPATVGVTRIGASPAAGGFVIKPKLYVLAVGVSRYQNPALTLGYSAKDAQDFARAMLTQKGRLYADVQERVLTDAKATRDGIVDGLDWVEKQTTQHDVAMVFLSGHGADDRDGNYVYIPVNFDMERIKATSVPFTDIKETVEGLSGKALFFVDTCHSGNVLGTAAGRDLQIVSTDSAVNDLSSAENGAVVFTASTGRQVALEDKAWGNGAFTKAVLEGLAGKAAYGHDGRVTVNMLDLYVSDRVKALTKGAQTPTTAKPQTVPDFPIALATRTASR